MYFFALLIAPKGIEIPYLYLFFLPISTFNRTKRNWNLLVSYYPIRYLDSFNRTKRNWNAERMTWEQAVGSF